MDDLIRDELNDSFGDMTEVILSFLNIIAVGEVGEGEEDEVIYTKGTVLLK